MDIGPKFGVVGSLFGTVALAVALMLASAGEGTHPSKAQMREALENELDRFRLPGMVMCGVVQRGTSRTDAIGCARTSISDETPFLVAFQERGEDSDIWSGLVSSAEGRLLALAFDSSPHGQPQVRAEYFVTSWECPAPTFVEVGPQAIGCSNDQP